MFCRDNLFTPLSANCSCDAKVGGCGQNGLLVTQLTSNNQNTLFEPLITAFEPLMTAFHPGYHYSGLKIHGSPVVHDYQIFKRTTGFLDNSPLFYTKKV